MQKRLSAIPKITLEQWAVFKAVVDEGSYMRAADALSKSQSSISYAIARLNELLPTPALVLDGRRAVLTEPGKALYRYAKNLLEQAQATEQAAEYLAGGWESSIDLVSDALTPMATVLRALQIFSEQSPLTRIKVLETTLSGTDEALLQRTCDVCITPHTPPGFLGEPLITIKMLPVVHCTHVLARADVVSESELQNHRQIVVRDTGIKREQNAGWLRSEQRWAVSHFATSVEAVRAGLGFAFLPEHRVRQDLLEGTLVRLPLVMGAERRVPLSLVIANPDHAGPGTWALAQLLRQRFRSDFPETE